MADNPTPELLQALCKFQTSTITAFKDSKGYGYKYASEEAINDALRGAKSLGLCHSFCMHPIAPEVDGRPGQTEVRLRLFHAPSGGFLDSSMNVDDYDPNNKKDARHQQRGSGISYARRYLLSAIAGLATSENEGETTRPPETEQQKKPSPAPKPNSPAQQQAKATPANGELQDLRGQVSAAMGKVYETNPKIAADWAAAFKKQFPKHGADQPKIQALNKEQLIFSQEFIYAYE